MVTRAHVFGAAESQHPVQGLDSHGDFGIPPGCPCAIEGVADHPLVAADVGLHQGPIVVAATSSANSSDHAWQ